MIRRFLTLVVFTATINLAAFGQHIFGREHLIVMAHEMEISGPAKIKLAIQKTDQAFAAIATQAGNEFDSCVFEDIRFVQHHYQA